MDHIRKIRKFYADLPLSVQILWPITILFLCSFFISIWLALREVEIKKEIRLKQVLKETQFDLTNFKKIAQYNLRLAYLFAQLPQVQEAIEKKDREELLNVVFPLFKTLNEHSPYPVFIHFYVPPGRSFLRLWKPEKFGDVVPPFRQTISSVLNTSQAVYGLEVGQIGFAVRGVAPIYGLHKRHIVGSVEVFCLLNDLLNFLIQNREDQHGDNIGLYMKKIKLSSCAKHYVQFGKYFILKAPSSFHQRLITEDFLDQASVQPVIKFYADHAIIGLPIKDFSSQAAAIYVRFYDFSFLKREREQIIKHHVIPALVFLLTSLVIILMVINQGVLVPIHRLKEEIEHVSQTVGKRLRESVKEMIMPITSSREITCLAQTINRLVYELDELSSFRQAIEIDRDPESIYKRLAVVFKEKFGLTNFAIFEVSNSQNHITVKLVDPPKAENEILCQGNTFDASLCRVFRSAKVSTSFHFTETCDFSLDEDANYVCLPMLASGKVIGIVRFVLPRDHCLNEKKKIIDQVIAYLQEAAPILEAKRFAQSLKEMSLRDPLTGLYNRRVLDDFLPQLEAGVKRRGTSMGVLMLDLDHFKVINDTYGHAFGDRVLSRVASIVRNNLRKSDLPVRYGGEEFLLLLPDSTAEGAVGAAERIRQEIAREPFVFEGQTVRVTISIGVAVFPDDDDQIDRVIKFADLALYQAKKRGRNCVVRFKKEFMESDGSD